MSKIIKPVKKKSGFVKANDDRYKTLSSIRKNGGNVTYKFADGTIQRQPVNSEMFTDDRGASRPLHKVMEVFEQTMLDRNAISFELN